MKRREHFHLSFSCTTHQGDRMSAFATSLTVVRRNEHSRLTSKRPKYPPFRPSPLVRSRCITNEATTPPQSTETNEPIILSYNQLRARTSRGRTSRSKYQTSLQAVQMPAEDRADDEQVTVWLVASKEKGGVLLRGRAKGFLKRSCDRCGSEFDEESDGIFDVLLKSELEDVDESLYDYVQNVESDEIQVSRHVREALYLGMQTRALCTDDCIGFTAGAEQNEVLAGQQGDDNVSEEVTFAQLKAGAALLEMKKRLEQKGL